jgi:hypothetical protein
LSLCWPFLLGNDAISWKDWYAGKLPCHPKTVCRVCGSGQAEGKNFEDWNAPDIIDKYLQKMNAAARLRRRETKARSLVAKAEAQARIARGKRGDGRPRRQVSRVDYKTLANTGGRVVKAQVQQRGPTVKREAR